MKSILVIILTFFFIVQAYDNHTYQIKSTLTQSTVRVDMTTTNLIVSDVEYPGWSEFFYMFTDDNDPTTFTLANFAFRGDNLTLGVDCSVKDQPCHISKNHTHFRLSNPSDLGKPVPIVNAENGYVWSVDDRNLPYGNIEMKEPNGSKQQSFVLLRWE